METLMDLEEVTRRLYREGKSKEEILGHLKDVGLNHDFSSALFQEIENSENLQGMELDIKDLINYKSTGLEAGTSGLGSRGEGDFIIHRAIATVANHHDDQSVGDIDVTANVVVGPAQQDDGGVVSIPEGDYLVVSVDGLHSRLGHFPFLAGFHVARACLRDVLVMGAKPVALFSDVHIGNNGDPAVVLDYTAGISTVGELAGVSLIAGSTLRIGGDLVTGDRLSGAAGAVGLTRKYLPRKDALPGDVLIMTRGSGGGTIAAAAIFHGKGEVVKKTLNLDFIGFTQKLLDSPLVNDIHTLTDVTNGGIRGDLHEIAVTAGVDLILYPERFHSLIDQNVHKMLVSLEIDPLGVSVDSLLVICPPDAGEKILAFMEEHGMDGDVVGEVEEGTGKVFSETEIRLEGDWNRDVRREEIKPRFREAPYTPVKKVADLEKVDPDRIRSKIDVAVESSIRKKNWLVERIRTKN